MVNAAHDYGVIVGVHAHNAEGIRRAIVAGKDLGDVSADAFPQGCEFSVDNLFFSSPSSEKPISLLSMMTTKNAPARRFLIATAVAGMMLGAPGLAQAEMVNCVQFVKKVSPVALHGNAYEWWDAASGSYERGNRPQPGAVMVFSKSRHLPYGHVAVVEKQIDERTVLIDHANWSRIAGHRGRVERSVRVVDVSQHNDWSQVRVWYASLSNVGNTAYALRGFVYPKSPPVHVGKPIHLHTR